MRRYSAHTICFMSILLLLVATGCSDPDESGGNPGLTAPVVVSVAPLSGASGTCINTIVTATFSKAMNPATINSTTFTLTGPSGTAELGQVTYNVASNTAIFAPAAALAPNTLYTAAISTRARDVFGIGLANRMVWSFTTGAGACSGVGAPAVVSATPANGACPNTIATAVFSEAMDPSTLDTATFTLTGPGTTPVNGRGQLRCAQQNRDLHPCEQSWCRAPPTRPRLRPGQQIYWASPWPATSYGPSRPLPRSASRRCRPVR